MVPILIIGMTIAGTPFDDRPSSMCMLTTSRMLTGSSKQTTTLTLSWRISGIFEFSKYVKCIDRWKLHKCVWSGICLQIKIPLNLFSSATNSNPTHLKATSGEAFSYLWFYLMWTKLIMNCFSVEVNIDPIFIFDWYCLV